MGKKIQKSGKGNAKKTSSNKRLIITVTLTVVIMIIGVGTLKMFETKSNLKAGLSVDKIADPSVLRGNETGKTINPAKFAGRTARSYQLAAENRELLDHMYCYCHCKRSVGHKSLLSCFVDNHAAKCDICQDQAFYALELQNEGLDLAQVRNKMDQKFWRPFR